MGLMGQALAQDLPQLNLKSKIQCQTQPRKFQGHLKLTLELAWRFWSLLHQVRSWNLLQKEHNSTQSPFLFVLVMSIFHYIIKIWRVAKIRLLKFMFICLLISVIAMDKGYEIKIPHSPFLGSSMFPCLVLVDILVRQDLKMFTFLFFWKALIIICMFNEFCSVAI
jgi:hypothetical protein